MCTMAEWTFGRGQKTLGGIIRTISASHCACIQTLKARVVFG